jgi:hypothetical protein
MYAVFPFISASGGFQDLNSCPHGHKATTLPLHRINKLYLMVSLSLHFYKRLFPGYGEGINRSMLVLNPRMPRLINS